MWDEEVEDRSREDRTDSRGQYNAGASRRERERARERAKIITSVSVILLSPGGSIVVRSSDAIQYECG